MHAASRAVASRGGRIRGDGFDPGNGGAKRRALSKVEPEHVEGAEDNQHRRAGGDVPES